MNDDYGNNGLGIEWARKELLRLVGHEKEALIFNTARETALELAERDPRTEFGWQLFHVLNKIIDDINIGASLSRE